MKVFENKTQIIKELVETKCDRCGSSFEEFNTSGPDIASFEHTFGYTSRRDGDKITFDLCEECLMRILEGTNVQYQYEERLW
jgi:protein-arginine kinase activator protein McsA